MSERAKCGKMFRLGPCEYDRDHDGGCSSQMFPSLDTPPEPGVTLDFAAASRAVVEARKAGDRGLTRDAHLNSQAARLVAEAVQRERETNTALLRFLLIPENAERYAQRREWSEDCSCEGGDGCWYHLPPEAKAQSRMDTLRSLTEDEQADHAALVERVREFQRLHREVARLSMMLPGNSAVYDYNKAVHDLAAHPLPEPQEKR